MTTLKLSPNGGEQFGLMFGRIGDASGDLKVKTDDGSIRLAAR